MNLPVVALVADRKMLGHHPFHCVGEKYIDALIGGAGCLPILLPALGERQNLDQILSLVQGLLFCGSVSMVDPRHYAGPDLPPEQFTDTHRDATTLPLMREAVARGVPVFGICRGAQEMNVAWGGTLLQKVHDTPGKMNHREDPATPVEIQYGPAHPVTFTPGGLIARCSALGTAQVNSLHNQGVDRLGEGLNIEAVAEDGLIEAFTVADARSFALGVQWHPEWQYQGNPLSCALFAAFGAACRTYADTESDTATDIATHQS